jgi:hypothetical protein
MRRKQRTRGAPFEASQVGDAPQGEGVLISDFRIFGDRIFGDSAFYSSFPSLQGAVRGGWSHGGDFRLLPSPTPDPALRGRGRITLLHHSQPHFSIPHLRTQRLEHIHPGMALQKAITFLKPHQFC